MTTVLLVTGSRALCASPEAERWGRGVLREAIASLPDGSLLLTGDARGPDTWAVTEAERHRVLWCAYALDGLVWWPGGRKRRWHAGELPTPNTEAWHRFPLKRNEALVIGVAVAKLESGYDRATALALVAPWAKTRGTGYTARLCRDAGIQVTELIAPAEYAPARAPLGGES